ncbi:MULTISPECIES: bile acid:sodium symporter family protein [unclassified Oceanobacter]|jgi:BASS family bile acid:Na+ symporter|uniref:bile acid:sodium symporter family protein n=1 Tax=unclassified Oceanobacter TaxID=2620260 RepID=UPI00273714BD|nr:MULTISPECIES: bile acid:sodium symporter family protein [unclassified Oceanobacter]MDP2547386.1 bile acid:sodium symporter family protein [Oceanobacter sp. 4_MG-2023]MDP2608174.1 bile acid:sodium symporter family protein [Oceanobacter sp. 1_MG-2023]MDP2612900.1 bile acid:sodium symporter family protein [Oceanobacter sp. 2_MG-2023]
MQQLVAPVILPIVLALIMFTMGLGLTRQHFVAVWRQPTVCLIGLFLQIVLLPVIALIIIVLFKLPLMAGAGLFLVALCPGGATSNMLTFLARGNVALSISLTAMTSLLVPFTLPVLFAVYMQFAGAEINQFGLPVGLMIVQLMVVTLVPVVLGMTLRHFWTRLAMQAERQVKLVATFLMLLVIGLLLVDNWGVVEKMVSLTGVAVMTLSVSALLLAWVITRQLSLNASDSRAITMEVGVQNAGTAMMVALTILHQPELAIVPLMYGLLMNIPVFGFIGWVIRDDGSELQQKVS